MRFKSPSELPARRPCERFRDVTCAARGVQRAARRRCTYAAIDAVARLLSCSTSPEIGAPRWSCVLSHGSASRAEAQLPVVAAALTAAPVAEVFNRDHMASIIEVV